MATSLIRHRPSLLLFLLFLLGSTPTFSQAGLTLDLGTITPQGANSYSFDILLTNTGSASISIAATSFGVETSDPGDTNITFTNATSDPSNYVFAGYSGDFAIFSTTDITSNTTPPPGSQLTAADFFYDPLNVLSDTTLTPGTTLALGRVFFTDTDPSGPTLSQIALITDASTTNLTDSSAAVVTGPISATATPGQYAVATDEPVTTPEPTTFVLVAQATGLIMVYVAWCRYPIRGRTAARRPGRSD